MAVNISPPVENSDFYLANWSTNFDAMREEEDLYHYTDIGGLHGILKYRQLWATHTHYLNDSSEIEYGLTWISEILKDNAKKNRKLLEKDPVKYADNGVYANLYDFIDQMAEGYRRTLMQDNAPFVTCLSRADDSLTQWQAYGAKGGGYCIKFDGKELEKSIRQTGERSGKVAPQPEITVDQVKYQTWNLHSDVETAVGEFFKDARGKNWTNEDSEPFQMFAKRLNEIAMLMKNQKFWPERERRICISGGRETFYTESRLGLVPRMRLGFSPKSIQEVMVGPGEHMDARKYSVERFISTQRYLKHVTVTTSEVPYREP